MASVKTNKQTKKSAQRGSEHDNTMTERRQLSSTQKKKEGHIDRFISVLHREINTVDEFSCTCDAVCMHVTHTVVTVHAICEGLFLFCNYSLPSEYLCLFLPTCFLPFCSTAFFFIFYYLSFTAFLLYQLANYSSSQLFPLLLMFGMAD